ncbi:MAG TPA: hypothetical protein VM557_12060 [Thermoanaerobaculia bacterium]|nr:hypothetical protein [Thermoanaerobaculia bacterium]
MNRRFLEDMLVSGLYFILLRGGLFGAIEMAGRGGVYEGTILGSRGNVIGIGLLIGALTAVLRLPFAYSIASVISGVALGAVAYLPAYTLFVFGPVFIRPNISTTIHFLILGIESIVGALAVLLLARVFQRFSSPGEPI